MRPSSGSLSGVAVVTGGASGIGAACAREFAKRGARVALLDRGAAGEAVAREIGGRAWVVDVADEAMLEACAAEVERALGPAEILVNSAGVIQVPLPPEELSMAAWDEVVRVDQRGTYVACAVFGKRMAARRRGSIVNIASIAGMRSMPLHAYAPAKAAVIAMTECLAAEWGPAQVRVNAVSPGYTRTPALQAAVDKGERDVSRLAANAALGRLVEPEEIARAVAFLAGPEAAAITGVNLPVDCGWLVAPSWHGYGGLRGGPA
jgi:NAD(P)-dependent dehydrogenase (short-subunit alcohol dehydrogenase family)